MRAEDILNPILDEDFKSFKKKMGTGLATAGLAAGALAAGGLAAYSKTDPVSWEQKVKDEAEDMGLSVEFVDGDKLYDVGPGGSESVEMPSEDSVWKKDVTASAAKLGLKAVFDEPVATSSSQPSMHKAASKTKPHKAKGKSFTPSREADWLALTMWGEARSQGASGMRAVGHVIKNRAMANKPVAFGSGIKGVVLHRKQFSCWNPGDPNRDAMLHIMSLDRDSLAWKRFMQARRIATEILNGESKDPTGHSLYYHTTGVRPVWSVGLDPIKKIANHLFFRRSL